jgi:hypothetical protein
MTTVISEPGAYFRRQEDVVSCGEVLNSVLTEVLSSFPCLTHLLNSL